jgi:hypothetical protein
MGGSGFGRRRGSGRRRVIQFLLGVLLVLAVVGSAYRVGLSASAARTSTLEEDLARSRQDSLSLRERLALAEHRSRQADAALADLRRRYVADVPDGELATLVAMLEEQLQAGAGTARLAFLIEAAGKAGGCASEPATKRFVPRTAASTGPQSAIRFDERIIVTGSGAASRNENGLTEAWFDPAEPVRIDFRSLAGDVGSVEGVLPLRHQMMVDGKEYRFAAIAGERSFIEISAQACDLPRPEPETTDGSGVSRPNF